MSKLSRLRTFAIRLIAAVNVLVVIALCVTGYAGMVSPERHPSSEMLTLLFPVPLLINLAFLLLWVFVRRQMIIIPVAGLLICLPAVRAYCPLNIPGSAPEGSIKVMSYNICGFTMDMPDGDMPSKAAKYVVEKNVDIVCFQEFKSFKCDSLRQRMLSETYPYMDSIQHKRLETIAVYSKYPILWHEAIPIEETNNVCGAFFLNIDGDTVMVLNCHLESNRLSDRDKHRFEKFVKRKSDHFDDRVITSKLTRSAAKRARQAQAISKYLKAHPNMSVVLCCDLNDTPISYAHHVLTRHLTDCHTATANGPGFTHKRDGIYVRIDNILCSDDWKPYACEIDTKVECSDHYPIICSLNKRQMPKK